MELGKIPYSVKKSAVKILRGGEGALSPTQTLWVNAVMKERGEKLRALQKKSSRDAMTGLYNRAGLENIAGLMGFARSQLGERIPSHQEHNEITIFAIDLNKLSGHDDVTETRKRIQETAVKNLLTRLEQMHVEEAEKQAKKNFAKALKAARKGRFSLALGSVSVVKRENMPEKQKMFTLKRAVRAVSRIIPNFMPLKPQEESGLFHHVVSMEDYLDRNRKKTAGDYRDRIIRDADMLGYLHKYTRKRKATSSFLVKVDAVRK